MKNHRPLILAVGLLLLLGMTVVAVWGISQNKQEDWWAAWGQWIGGVGSILAATVAVWIAMEGWYQADRERRDDEITQARLVVARFSSSLVADYILKGVAITNLSASPVFDVGIDEVTILRLRGMPDEDLSEFVSENVDQTPRTLATGEETSFGIQLPTFVQDENIHVATPPEHISGAIIRFRFQDASGRLWRRVGQAQPHRVLGR